MIAGSTRRAAAALVVLGWAASLAVLAPTSMMAAAEADRVPETDRALEVEVRQQDGGRWVFDIVGVPQAVRDRLASRPQDAQAWRAGFTVTSVDEDGQRAPVAMLGSYVVVGDRLRFVPRFPAVRGLTYEVRVDLGKSAFVTRVLVPADPRPPTTVTVVHPESATVPANLLRIYIHFSHPMARNEAYRHIRLERTDGTRVEAPFLELPEELWDEDRRRFTLLFDPGRLKRGLSPHEALGPPLTSGGRYRLILDGGWRDAQGRPLGVDHVTSLQVVADDRTAPRLDDWQIETPAAGSRQPLVVDFGEALDHALARRTIYVFDAAGESIAGTIAIEGEGRRWAFTPDRAWSAGRHRLVVDGDLEDLAGNSLRGVFDRDLGASEQEADTKTFARPFEIDGRDRTTASDVP